jgi:inorganic pyrophosphatase
MRLELLPIGKNPPEEVNVVVEVPVGGEPIKYEIHKESGALMVDRFLYTAMRYPGNYGFIPHTLSDDGDPCDVVIANQRGLLPGSVIAVRPVGVLRMNDEAGGDEKIVEITRQQIQHFFEHYKDLEPGKWVKITGWGDAAEARGLISEGIARYAAGQAK